ncbi:PIG-L deacetylase family protein [Nocardioides mangrovicus]|uniref:PIG-L deacetylase family protein n=1 Tax=Nocardioides mangrovicus TaxID=2478913 RepID=UPI001314FEF4|nr:PIG-L family deacetylase [Nocardioides mangrovicus]
MLTGGTDPGTAVLWDEPVLTTSWPLARDARVLVVGAHPDDETIGAGRLLAAHHGRCDAVVLSAGEACLPDGDRRDLGHQRLAEWRAALSHLGVRPLEAPRWPDGELAAYVAEIEEALRETAADYDVVLAPWRHDPHPDHEAVGRAALAAAPGRVVAYPVWTPFWTTPTQLGERGARLVGLRTPASAHRAWTAAVAEYASQTRPLRPGWAPIVPAELLRRQQEQLLVVDDA